MMFRLGDAVISDGTIDPWGSNDAIDYAKLLADFGIEPLSTVRASLGGSSRLARRGVWFGHRDLGLILNAAKNGQDFAVMSGIKPSSPFHLGTKTTTEAMSYFQSISKKCRVHYCIADIEAYCDNGLKFSQSGVYAVDNVADALALGLEPDRTYVYRQSQEIRVANLSAIFSRGVTASMMRAIYGERQFGLYMSALVQAGDILLPELRKFGGPKPVLVPVGADQDPHIRLARDLAFKFREQFGFVPPSAVFHKIVRGLDGSPKMSKRSSATTLTFSDDDGQIRTKLMSAVTGGRATTDEQRKMGGEPDKCVIYEYYRDHFLESDTHLREVREECLTGKRLCGECKLELVNLVLDYAREHRRKKAANWDKATQLVEAASKPDHDSSEIF